MTLGAASLKKHGDRRERSTVSHSPTLGELQCATHIDNLGSSREIVQSGQTSPCYDADFYPYGGERAYINTCPQNYKFTGKERDSESGLDEFGARYYSSAWGRFMIPDWAAKPTTVPYANFGNPQSLNLYTYVQNNPATVGDVDGHGELGDKFKAIFYVKPSVGVMVGGEVKLTNQLTVKAEGKAAVETKVTTQGSTTVAKVEASAGAKVGPILDVNKKASAEIQLEKDGKVDLGTPKFEYPKTLNAGPVEVSSNSIAASYHNGPSGLEAGIDLDKAGVFVDAVKVRVSRAVDSFFEKISPSHH